MALTFERATKRQAKLRLAVTGPAGSGKTYTALAVGSNLGKRLAVIDTEHGSASKYASEFQFDTLSLETFHPERYVEAMKVASDAGYDVLVIDSASHEWFGVGGCLELVDAAATRSRGNSYVAWRDVTPLHNRFMESIHQAPLHVIATFRSKMEYAQSEREGRKTVEKLGMAPITRDGAEYEFDVVLDLDIAHTGVVSKSRAKALADAVYRKPGADFAKALSAWLSDGAPEEKIPPRALSHQPDNEAGTVPPLPTSPANSEAAPAASDDMDYLYQLGEKVVPKQNKLQIDVLVKRHGYAHIRTRLENAITGGENQ